MPYIYIITNNINNKSYIGKTHSSDPLKRWNQHKSDSKKDRNKSRPLYRAINKYGIENFSFKILEETDNPEQREVYYIEHFKTYKNGYNATLGGDGKPRINNQTQIIDFILSNPQIPLYTVADKFKICTDSIINILKQNKIYLKPNRSLCKEVNQYTKDGVFVNTFTDARTAATSLGNVSLNAHINSCCNNKRKTCKGFIWKFKTDAEGGFEPPISRL